MQFCICFRDAYEGCKSGQPQTGNKIPDFAPGDNLEFRDETDGFDSLMVDHFCIDLGGGDVGVAEYFADCVEIGAIGEKEGGAGVAADVEYTRRSKQ